eukprot:TRINITY_DN80044_c0_g1_i1.p1 TRINITY_DN80044_c0_g1~~TRINITY_DN80044_c0_g1_i1.p1  ORF type:complete len:135 (+),score=11.41 TRINITY_DN80044_c0_g1_i1:28-405(+)
MGGVGGMGGLDPALLQQRMFDDPNTMKLLSSMMENISPQDLAAMSERMGMGQGMTVEQAEQAKRVMQGLGPDRLATVMKFAQRAQTTVIKTRNAIQWLLDRPVLLVSIIIMIVAIVVHYFGLFGR